MNVIKPLHTSGAVFILANLLIFARIKKVSLLQGRQTKVVNPYKYRKTISLISIKKDKKMLQALSINHEAGF